MHFRFTAALAFAFFASLGPLAVCARTIAADDYRATVALTSPAISPDGKRAVVVLTKIAWDDDVYRRDLLLIDLATHATRVLTYDRKGLSDPAFSPDGTQLAFLSDAGKGDDANAQVWLMPLDGGDPRPVTKAPQGVDGFSWRPDGKAIAYSAVDAKPVHKGAARFRDSFLFTTEPITSRKTPSPVHIFAVPVSGGAATQLTFGAMSAVSTLSWSPDGRAMAVGMAPTAILNDADDTTVHVLDVATKKLRKLTSHTSFEGDPLFSPDGKHILYAHSAGDNQINVTSTYVTTPAGGEGIDLGKTFDRTIHQAAWQPDSRGVFVSFSDQTAGVIARAPLTGTPQRLKLGELVPSSPLAGAIARDGSMVFVASAPKEATELYHRSADGVISKLTSQNARLTALELGATEQIVYETSTGVKGDAVLYKPPGFTPARTYPLVVYIHGGPTSASLQSFDFWAQLMAAHGWLVLRPNYRGSDNLGLTYQRAVLYDPEEGPGKDILAAVNAVRVRGIVDPSRIAVSGWSYGGIMTAWLISKYHIWKAAVSGASVNDWATDYGVADDSNSDVALFHGSPFVGNNAAEWRRASAITYARDVTSPVLILSDIGDNRDPFATSAMYWRALRDNHKDATLRVWPVDGHFPRDPVRTADVYHYWIDYIAQHFR
ncbi:MAG: S9 family peptidase [Candidatus Eremiobacteraeota bacterium]|nr:S9 family peptidase [Candidatus Eremiobacteraeota bacterium]